MKLKMKLVKTQETDTEKGETFSYFFVATLEEYKKNVKLVIICEDPYAVMGKLGLPTTRGDNIVLDMISKEEQSKLEDGHTKFHQDKMKKQAKDENKRTD